MRTIIISALAALSLAVIATPASAETTTIAVPYGDLNLSSAAGMATLEGRIAAAAEKVCGKPEVRDIHDGVDQRRCAQAARSSVSVEIARATGNRRVLAANSRSTPRR